MSSIGAKNTDWYILEKPLGILCSITGIMSNRNEQY